MITVTRRFEWDAAHRVHGHEGRCASLHGHRWVAEVTVSGPELDHLGRVIDFGVLKETIGLWIDKHWDHTTLVGGGDMDLRDFCKLQEEKGNRPAYIFDKPPTAEVIACELFKTVAELIIYDRKVDFIIQRVRVRESPNCWADMT